jgi:oligogalacturonide lyase
VPKDWRRGEWLEHPLRRMTDEETGRTILQVTCGEGNNRHIYFNRPNFTSDGRQLILLSDRTGSWQVYAHDLQSQRVRRLTECRLDPGRPAVDAVRPAIYYTQGPSIHRIDLGSLEEQVVYRHNLSPGGTFVLLDLSHDGQYLVCMELAAYDATGSGPTDFVRRFEVRPLTRIWVIAADGAHAWMAHEEYRHLQHMLFRPGDPSTILYCHEGPWDRVDQRMWLMHWDGSGIRPLRVQEHPGITIGHEYWMDRHRVAYMYACSALGHAKSVRWFDLRTEKEQVVTEHPYSHFISDRAGARIVGDDPEYVTLLDMESARLTPLARHGQALTVANTLYHPHPAFHPSGKAIVFCRRDAEGHNDVCLIDLSESLE